MTRAGDKFRTWTEAETRTLLELAGLYSDSVIAQRVGRSVVSVHRMYQKLAKAGKVPKRTKSVVVSALSATAHNASIIELPPKYLDMMKAVAELAVVFSDVHLPCIDWALFELLLKVAKRQGIRACVVGGDLFDFKLFSTFADAKATGEDELTMGEQAAVRFFSMLLDQFDKVWVICGNHDFRVFNFTQGKISERKFFRFMTHITEDEKRVQFSAYRHMVLNEKWRIVHPSMVGSNFELEGCGEAVKYQQNIAVTHVHRMGWKFDPSGRLVALGTGALLDPTTQAYVMKMPSKAPMWNTGFTIIQGWEYFYLLPKFRTDWDRWTGRRWL